MNRIRFTTTPALVLLLACDLGTGLAVGEPALEGAPDIAAGAGGPTAYVTQCGQGTVAIVDVTTHTLSATVPAGTCPYGVAVNPAGTRLYVTNSTFPGSVSVLSTATLSILQTIPVQDAPRSIVIHPSGDPAYVGNAFSNTVSVIATATGTVMATIPVPAPRDLAIAPNGSTVYSRNGISPQAVTVISTATNSVVATIDLPPSGSPGSAAVTPDGAFLYVAASRPAAWVIETATHTVTHGIDAGAPITTDALAISPAGDLVYVTDFANARVLVVATATNSIVRTVAVGPNPRGVAFTPAGDAAYVLDQAGSGAVSVIETASHSLITTVPLTTGGPSRVAIAPVVPGAQPQLEVFMIGSDPTAATFRAEWTAAQAPYAWDARPLDRRNGRNVFGEVRGNGVTFSLPRGTGAYDAEFRVWEKLPQGYNALGRRLFVVP